jgi:hypothetical protein
MHCSSSILEIFMITNVEGAAGDIAADLAALREDVARLAEAMRKLVQNQPGLPATASPTPLETPGTGSQAPPSTYRIVLARRTGKSRPASRVTR